MWRGVVDYTNTNFKPGEYCCCRRCFWHLWAVDWPAWQEGSFWLHHGNVYSFILLVCPGLTQPINSHQLISERPEHAGKMNRLCHATATDSKSPLLWGPYMLSLWAWPHCPFMWLIPLSLMAWWTHKKANYSFQHERGCMALSCPNFIDLHLLQAPYGLFHRSLRLISLSHLRRKISLKRAEPTQKIQRGFD